MYRVGLKRRVSRFLVRFLPPVLWLLIGPLPQLKHTSRGCGDRFNRNSCKTTLSMLPQFFKVHFFRVIWVFFFLSFSVTKSRETALLTVSFHNSGILLLKMKPFALLGKQSSQRWTSSPPPGQRCVCSVSHCCCFACKLFTSPHRGHFFSPTTQKAPVVKSLSSLPMRQHRSTRTCTMNPICPPGCLG